MVFHVSIWGGLELRLGGLSPQNPPRGDVTGLIAYGKFIKIMTSWTEKYSIHKEQI